MKWNDILQLFGPTEWVQAIASILALILSVRALVIAKRTQRTSSFTDIRPVSILWDKETYSNLKVVIHSSGPGLAYDLKVSAFKRLDYLKKRSRLSIVHEEIFAKGPTSIQPNGNVQFLFKGFDMFVFHHKRPIRVSYKLGDGSRSKSYWTYLLGENGEIVPMKKWI